MDEEYEGITGRNSKTYSLLFFIVGLIGAVGFRAVLIINKFNFLLATLVWYIASISYVFYYLYRYYIEQKRREILISSKLKYKLDNNLELDKNDRKSLKKIVDSLIVSKQNLNLIILIILSFISLAIQLILDLLIS